jgi:hypothetical protein
MNCALYELALHPEIQNRLRAEIVRVLNEHNGQLTYDGIQEMAYLDRVVSGRGIYLLFICYLQLGRKPLAIITIARTAKFSFT